MKNCKLTCNEDRYATVIESLAKLSNVRRMTSKRVIHRTEEETRDDRYEVDTNDDHVSPGQLVKVSCIQVDTHDHEETAAKQVGPDIHGFRVHGKHRLEATDRRLHLRSISLFDAVVVLHPLG